MDEDEQDANPDDDFMNQYGNAAFGGGDGGFGNIDFSKLGSGPGGDPVPDGSDSEDEEMPDLEDAKDSDNIPAGEDEKKTAAGGKIEEVE